MTASREFEFTTGIETSPLPDPSAPSGDSDTITLGFALQVVGTRAAPIAIAAAGIASLADALRTVYFIEGDSGAVDVTADPQIVAGTRVGAILQLIGRDGTNTVKWEHGTGLDLNGNFTMGEGDVLELMWDGSNWHEIGRSER